MIYLDTSVLLAHRLAEDRSPPEELWERPLVASRLLAGARAMELGIFDLP